MITKIIPFPNRPDQNLSEVETVIRGWLARISTDNDLVEHVVKQMLLFINTYACQSFEPIFNLSVPADLSKEQADALVLSIDQGVQDTAVKVNEMVNKIIVERFFMEIELYVSQKRYGNKNYFT